MSSQSKDSWTTSARTCNDRGWEFVSAGDLNGAMASAEQPLRLDGDSPDAHNVIGYIHAANGNLDMALKSPGHRPRRALPRGHAQRRRAFDPPLGSLAEAIRVLDQALESCQTADDIADASVLKVDALLQQGDRAAAAELLVGVARGRTRSEQLQLLIGHARFELEQESARHLNRTRSGTPGCVPRRVLLPRALAGPAGAQWRSLTGVPRTRHLDGLLPSPPWSPSHGRLEKSCRRLSASSQRVSRSGSRET